MTDQGGGNGWVRDDLVEIEIPNRPAGVGGFLGALHRFLEFLIQKVGTVLLRLYGLTKYGFFAALLLAHGPRRGIKVSKCFYMPGATGMLVKAASSDVTARLFAYLPDGTYLGELQNGGGSRYGGTVLIAPSYDPGYVVVVSSSGGTTSAPTTPFQI